MTTDKDQYKVHQEPFYQPQGNEVALYEAAFKRRLPVMVGFRKGRGGTRESRAAQP